METQNAQFTQIATEVVNNNLDSKEVHKALPTLAEIQAWLIIHLAQQMGIEPDQVDVKTAFERYGLDSSAAVGLIGDLEDWLGYELDPTLIYDYPNIEALSQHLAHTNSL